jgi:hypothetical protein
LGSKGAFVEQQGWMDSEASCPLVVDEFKVEGLVGLWTLFISKRTALLPGKSFVGWAFEGRSCVPMFARTNMHDPDFSPLSSGS